MQDQFISVPDVSQVLCPCGWIGSLEDLEGEKANSDTYRWDYKCPNCKSIVVYASHVLGAYAKGDVKVEIEKYEH